MGNINQFVLVVQVGHSVEAIIISALYLLLKYYIPYLFIYPCHSCLLTVNLNSLLTFKACNMILLSLKYLILIVNVSIFIHFANFAQYINYNMNLPTFRTGQRHSR